MSHCNGFYYTKPKVNQKYIFIDGSDLFGFTEDLHEYPDQLFPRFFVGKIISIKEVSFANYYDDQDSKKTLNFEIFCETGRDKGKTIEEYDTRYVIIKPSEVNKFLKEFRENTINDYEKHIKKMQEDLSIRNTKLQEYTSKLREIKFK